MNAMMEWFGTTTWICLVQALLHSLWQAAAISLGLVIYLRGVPAQRAEARYRACVLSLLLVAGGVFVTWNALETMNPAPAPSSSGSAERRLSANPNSGGLPVSTAPADQAPGSPPETVAAGGGNPDSAIPFTGSAGPLAPRRHAVQWEAWAAWIWLVGSVLAMVRVLSQVLAAGRVRQEAELLQDPTLRQWVERLCRELRLNRSLRLLVSRQIQSPVVMGALWPVLLFPAWMVTGQSVLHLQAVVAHEVAHIRRYDHLVNLGQMVLESLLFFNPFVWFMSRQTRLEREASCDAWAVSVLGEPAAYADALVAVAQRWRGGHVAPAAALGFAEPRHPSHLLERIKRLLAPAYRPPMRLRWFSLLASLALSLGVLTAFYGSSRGAVLLAAKILSPKERIEKIAEVQRQYAPGREENQAGPIRVAGSLRTEDGSPLPGKPVSYILVATVRPNSVSMSSLKLEDGVFQGTVEAGQTYLSAELPGYAPCFAGPLTALAGEIKDVQLVVGKGVAAGVRLIDQDGQPVPNAPVEVNFDYRGRISSQTQLLRGDAEGLITFEHSPRDASLSLRITTDGYEETQMNDLKLGASPLTVIVARSRSVTGQIRSAVTHQPIEGATLRCICEERPDTRNCDLTSSAKLLATTDVNGRFVLGRLRSQTRYWLRVEAPGCASDWLSEVTQESPPLEKELGPAFVVNGRIVGLPGMSSAGWGELKAEYRQWSPNSACSSRHDLALRPDEGGARFQLTNLWAGRLLVTAGGKTFEGQVDRVLTNLTFNWAEATGARAAREVVFHFNVKPGQPNPEGTLMVRALQHEPEPVYPMPKALPIVNGEARMAVEVPGKVMIEPYGLVGYWPLKKNVSEEWEIPAGEGSYLLKVDVEPAGVIYGEIPEEKSGAGVHVIEVKAPPLRFGSYNLADLNNHIANQRGRTFSATPLPLGGVYRVLLNERQYYALSDPIALNEAQPIHRLAMKLPAGKNVSGSVVLPSGKPAAGVLLKLVYTTPFHQGFGGPPVTADPAGRFSFTDVNPDIPGDYRVVVQPGFDCQSAEVPLSFDPNWRIQLKAGLTIAGVVIDADTGRGIPRVKVDFNPKGLGHDYAGVTTDDKGRFRFSNLGSGDYHFYAEGLENLVDQQQLSVNPAKTNAVTVRVRRAKGRS